MADYVARQDQWRRLSGEHLAQARAWFEEAVANDPESAPAHTGLAQTLLLMGQWGTLPPQTAFRRAHVEATEALNLDPRSAPARSALGTSKHLANWDWTGAERDFRIALALDPRSLPALCDYACLLRSAGRFEEMAVLLDHVQAIVPGTPRLAFLRGAMAYALRDYDGAIRFFDAMLEQGGAQMFAQFTWDSAMANWDARWMRRLTSREPVCRQWSYMPSEAG